MQYFPHGPLVPLLHRQVPPVPVVLFSAMDVGPEVSARVEAALVKSRVSNDRLLALIESLLDASNTKNTPNHGGERGHE